MDEGDRVAVIQFNISTYLKYVFVYCMRMGGRECMYVHHGHAEVRRGTRPLTPELQTVVSCHMSPGN